MREERDTRTFVYSHRGTRERELERRSYWVYPSFSWVNLRMDRLIDILLPHGSILKLTCGTANATLQQLDGASKIVHRTNGGRSF